MAISRQLTILVTSILTLSALATSTASAAKNKCSKVFLVSATGSSIEDSTPLIPEILSLKKNQSIPDSIIKKYSPTQIATSLVKRLENNSKAIRAKAGKGFNPLTGTDIMMFFREENFMQILEKGFLNYHQVGFTRGDSTTGGRASQEDFLVQAVVEKGGYDSFIRQKLMELYEQGKMDQKPKVMRESRLQSPFNRIRPKYAYLFINDKTVDIGETVFRSQYGHYGAVFKDEVKSRSTWTPTDSLGAKPSDMFTFQDQMVDVKAHGDRDVKYYFEAQIWGDLKLSDVAYWLLPEGSVKSSEIYKLMKKTGIPIMKYKMDDVVHQESGHKTYSPTIIESI